MNKDIIGRCFKNEDGDGFLKVLDVSDGGISSGIFIGANDDYYGIAIVKDEDVYIDEDIDITENEFMDEYIKALNKLQSVLN